MKAAVANSSEMIWSNPNQLISALSRSQKLCAVLFCNVTFLEALAPLGELKDVWGCFFGGIFSTCFLWMKGMKERPHCPIATETVARKDDTCFFATSQRMASIDAFRQHSVFSNKGPKW